MAHLYADSAACFLSWLSLAAFSLASRRGATRASSSSALSFSSHACSRSLSRHRRGRSFCGNLPVDNHIMSAHAGIRRIYNTDAGFTCQRGSLLQFSASCSKVVSWPMLEATGPSLSEPVHKVEDRCIVRQCPLKVTMS